MQYFVQRFANKLSSNGTQALAILNGYHSQIKCTLAAKSMKVAHELISYTHYLMWQLFTATGNWDADRSLFKTTQVAF